MTQDEKCVVLRGGNLAASIRTGLGGPALVGSSRGPGFLKLSLRYVWKHWGECRNHANKIFLRLRHQTQILSLRSLTLWSWGKAMATIHIQGGIIILAVFFSI